MIKNSMLQVDEALDDETLLKLNILLNTHLNGLSIEEINLGMIAELKKQAGIHSAIVSDVIDAVAEAIKSELINVFEEKKSLNEFVTETLTGEENTGIQVYIGSETPVQSMKDCSVVTATYDLGEGMRGTVGIIGPKRMDYDKVISTLKTLMNELDTLYKK